MVADEAFAERIKLKLAEAAVRRDEELQKLTREMVGRDRETAAFEHIAEPLHSRIVRPAIEQLREQLGHGTVDHYRTANGFYSTCRLERTEQVPAWVSVTIGLERSPDRSGVLLTYRLSIVPMFFSFEPGGQLPVTAEKPESIVRAWVERQLLQFLETYLRIGSDPNYQQDTIRKDPVCGMLVAASLLPHRQRLGSKTYYFCSENCLHRFAANPDLYLAERVAVGGTSCPDHPS